MAHQGYAGRLSNTIDRIAVVDDDGRHLVVTGPIQCTQKEKTLLRVTVTQRETGALAEGHTGLLCTSSQKTWKVHLVTQSEARFREGPATAVALARTVDRRVDVIDADPHQWLVNIELVEE
jgi:hypothetical protein